MMKECFFRGLRSGKGFIFFIFSVGICLTQIANAQIGVDAVSSATSSGAVTTLTWSHTTGTQNNRVLIVTVAAAGNNVSGITYNGVALTSRITAINTVRVAIWYLVNPPSGTYNIIVTHGAAKELICGGITFYNATQGAPTKHQSATGTATANPTSPNSVATHPSANDIIFDVVATLANTATVGAGQTSRWNLTQSSGFKTGATSTRPGTGAAQGTTWTAASDTWAIAEAAVLYCTEPTPGTASGTTPIVAGATTALSVAGESGSCSYQWQQSTDNVTFTDIAGAITDPYTTAAINAEGTYYYRCKVYFTAGTQCYAYTTTATVVVANTTYTVTNTSDAVVAGSLRTAINSANASGAPATIAFNIAGGTKQTFTLGSALPSITGNYIKIDGTTQPGVGYPGVSPKIIINANNNTVDVLTITGNNCTVYGLYLKGGNSGINCSGDNLIVGANGKRNVISGNTGYSGIYVHSNLTSLIIKGNYIGVDTLGTTAEANGNATDESGIEISSSVAPSGLNIGGSTAGDGNVISGNYGHGIYYSNTTSSITIKGNYIGTNAAGTAAIANGGNGIYCHVTTTTAVIGGTSASERNVISGNTANGIYLYGTVMDGTIYNNYIGTNAAGTAKIANGANGIYLKSTTCPVLIGGGSANQGNLISGNADNGILLDARFGGSGKVAGNTIGGGSAGYVDLGNTNYGILSYAENNKIGGTGAGEGNMFYFNGKEAIYIKGDTCEECYGVGTAEVGGVYNSIRRNKMSCNSKTSGNGGIEFGTFDPNQGAPYVAVVYGNHNKAAPVITSANTTTVSGTSTMATDTIEVFLDDICSVSAGTSFVVQTVAVAGAWTAVGTFNGSVTATATYAHQTSKFATKVATGALPIDLLSFTAQYNKGIVDLAWSTATETNNDYFTIERSANGTDFEIVANVKGAGTSTTKLNYTSVDESPLKGTSYYRLVQTDFDGKFTYSKLVPVENTNVVTSLIYPNPSNGASINIKVNGVEEREVLVVLYNALGETAYSKLLINDGGNGILTATIEPESSLTPGVYYIVATSKNELFRKMLVVSGQK